MHWHQGACHRTGDYPLPALLRHWRGRRWCVVNWKVYGTCYHLIWANAGRQPYKAGDLIWCGPCGANSIVHSITAVDW